MHASIEQLLSLRDGEPNALKLVEHVEKCAICAHELARLRATHSLLRALPQLKAPYFDASKYQANHAVPSRTPRYAVLGALAAGMAMLAIAINLMSERTPQAIASQPMITKAAPIKPQTSIDTEHTISPGAHHANNATAMVLEHQSQRLERLLKQLPERPRAERAATAATIEALQTRIQWVDYQLSLANEVGLNEQQSMQLWQDRVALMDSLIKVRYTQAQPLTALL